MLRNPRDMPKLVGGVLDELADEGIINLSWGLDGSVVGGRATLDSYT